MLPTSLEVLDISGGARDRHKFTGGIPPEWGALANLKQLNMARCGLDGVFGSTRSERFNGSCWRCATWCLRTGELPLEIFRMKAKGIIPKLGLCANGGFTLPLNIGELGDDISELNLSNCSLTGPLSTRTERLRVLLTLFRQGNCPSNSAN